MGSDLHCSDELAGNRRSCNGRFQQNSLFIGWLPKGVSWVGIRRMLLAHLCYLNRLSRTAGSTVSRHPELN